MLTLSGLHAVEVELVTRSSLPSMYPDFHAVTVQVPGARFEKSAHPSGPVTTDIEDPEDGVAVTVNPAWPWLFAPVT
jgi:hypothetical protein